MNKKLAVWKTLKRGGKLHFLLGNSIYVGNDLSGDPTAEIYLVNIFRLFMIDIIEFICGYKRVVVRGNLNIYI